MHIAAEKITGLVGTAVEQLIQRKKSKKESAQGSFNEYTRKYKIIQRFNQF